MNRHNNTFTYPIAKSLKIQYLTKKARIASANPQDRTCEMLNTKAQKKKEKKQIKMGALERKNITHSKITSYSCRKKQNFKSKTKSKAKNTIKMRTKLTNPDVQAARQKREKTKERKKRGELRETKEK